LIIASDLAFVYITLFVVIPIWANPKSPRAWLSLLVLLMLAIVMVVVGYTYPVAAYLVKPFLGFSGAVVLLVVAIFLGVPLVFCRHRFAPGKDGRWKLGICLPFLTAFAIYLIGASLKAGSIVQRDRSYDEDCYGSGYDETGFHLGTIEVAVPPPHIHNPGRLEEPLNFCVWRLDAAPGKHIVVLGPPKQVSESKAFFDELQEAAQHAPKKNQAFVFIHGYDTSFDLAARKTAQICVDLKCQYVGIFYSWPSQGREVDYGKDHTMADRTPVHLKDILSSLISQAELDRVHLIAHSMGNDVLTKALKDLQEEMNVENSPLREIVLAAPDLDAVKFQQQTLPWLVNKKNRRVTLYASSKDDALIASHQYNGDYRVGDTTGGLFPFQDIDSIDASTLDKKVNENGHSYISEDPFVLEDLYWLLEGKSAQNRFYLRSAFRNQIPYYEFRRVKR
jgi:esterase/lipase superfamily enzyme